ncbi:MAG TPA: trypsin-like peptidase domain-containing protein [Trebonia sp.]|nr:trypsin-like peptidase domain-containing protein [Trebonia sp.]
MSDQRGKSPRRGRHQGQEKRGRRWWPWAPLVGGFVVVGVVGGLIGWAIASPSSSNAATGTTGTTAGSTSAVCAATSVANEVLPSVVTISVSGPGGAGTGSGEILQSSGYIVTNNHVIAPAASGGTIQVLFADGASVPATLVGRDVQTDLAVIKVQSTEGMKPIALGTSSSVVVGQPVVALGAPLGLSNTVTSGIVSALDRTVEVPADADKNALLVSAVQTDAAINPGNSGGALVNCAGQLIGIPSAGATVPTENGGSSAGNIGIGFAIPVDLAKTISNEIIASGQVTHAYFGLQTVPIPASAAQEAGVQSGLFVQAVVPSGPSASAGLRQGDVITEIDGQPATSNVQLQEITLTKKPGDQVTLTYDRSGKTNKATVTLGTQP